MYCTKSYVGRGTPASLTGEGPGSTMKEALEFAINRPFGEDDS
jgi:hypothetical protein